LTDVRSDETAAIELRGLTKRFGDTLALDRVDLVVRPGVVFGFLGRNGAGKTTALRILSGLARPTAGTAHILGHDVERATDAVRARIGFLPDVPGFYPWMTAREYLEFAGRLFGLYATTGRAVSFLAPALFGLFTYLFGSDRAGIVGILLVLGAGLLALLPVKSPPLSGPEAGAEPAFQL